MIRLVLCAGVSAAVLSVAALAVPEPALPSNGEPTTENPRLAAELPALRGLPSGAPTPESDPTTVGWASARVVERAPVRAAVPTSISIPSLDVAAAVVGLGVDGDGRMDVPDNVHEVGWYRFGPAPGEPGSAVLAAHVDMAGFGPGVFFDLDRMRVGDVAFIEFDDGSRMELVVSHIDHVAKSALDTETLFERTGPTRVRLVTCGGSFDTVRRSYEDNVVVTLTPTQEDR